MTQKAKFYVPKKDEEYVAPFGPVMGYKKLTPSFVKKMNTLMKMELDDWSDNLVGKVKQELRFNKEIESLWLKEVSQFIGRFHSYTEHRNSFGVKALDTEKYNYGIQIVSGWFVRQFENEYNPLHIHTGCRYVLCGLSRTSRRNRRRVGRRLQRSSSIKWSYTVC